MHASVCACVCVRACACGTCVSRLWDVRVGRACTCVHVCACVCPWPLWHFASQVHMEPSPSIPAPVAPKFPSRQSGEMLPGYEALTVLLSQNGGTFQVV